MTFIDSMTIIYVDFMEEEEFDIGPNKKTGQLKPDNLPIFPKEEEFEEEFDKMMEERYKNASAFNRHADEFDPRSLFEKDALMPQAKDPTIWKVKCAVCYLLYPSHFKSDNLSVSFLLHLRIILRIIYFADWSREAFSFLPYAEIC